MPTAVASTSAPPKCRSAICSRSAKGGPHLVGEGTYGHGAEAFGCHDPLRGVEKGGAGALVMFPGSTHLDGIT